MDTNNSVIRSCLLYEFKLGAKAIVAARKICMAFGDHAVSSRTAQKWFKRFTSGNYSLTDEARSGRPKIIENDNIKEAVESNSSATCADLAQMFNLSAECIRLRLHQMGKTWKLSKWIPHDLSEDNKLSRLSICSANFSRNEKYSFLDSLLTCDEKWILYSNSRRSYHWLSSTDPIPHTPKNSLHPKKILLCVWWTTAGIIHYEFLVTGRTITSGLYCEQLQRVQEALIKKQPSLINRKKVIFLQDNAKPHTAKISREKISELGWDLLPHPPYSPDISPTDYHLFLALDNFMRNKQFKTQVEVTNAVRQFFESKSVDFYRNGIQKLSSRWERVIECEGNYFDE